MNRILAIVGPTASGKTALSVALAKAYNGEILSCDSMQLYRGMDIGTAKPTREERAGVPHHLFDLANVTDSFSCAEYQKAARAAIADVQSRGKLPIFCGGTGLYLDSVLYDRPFSEIPLDPALRARLNEQDADALYAQLCRVDPDSAAITHANNKKRVVRALEIYHLTGKTKTQWDAESRAQKPLYDATLIGLDFADRSTLYARINARVEQMIAAGLEAEVRALPLAAGQTAAQAIGYRELLDCFAGRCDRETAIERIKQNSRNYAKRQLTWFRAHDVRWIVRTGEESEAELLRLAKELLAQNGFLQEGTP